MRLRSIHLQRFRGFRAGTTVELRDGINVVVGDNGSGKSSVVTAVEWCLFGREVESKGSGIAEYKDREIRHRADDDGDTGVRLVFDSPGGEVTVSRTRAAEAKARSPDDRLEVRDEAGDLRSGDDAERWLAERAFPTWMDWRSSHCQHQEDARHRLLDGASLKASLATLLGLDDLVDLRNRFDAVRLGSHVKAVKRIEAQQSDELLDLATSTGPQQDAAAACERLGVDPQRVTREAARGETVRLLDAARDLVREQGLTAPVPDNQGDLDEVIEWAGGWPDAVRSQPGNHSRLPGLRQESGELSALVGEVEPLARQVAQAQESLRASIERDGDSERRLQALADAREEAARANANRKAADALRSLLQDAAGVLDEGVPDECPVCESAVPDLSNRVKARLDDLSSQAAATLDEACTRANQAVTRAIGQSSTLTQVEDQLTRARQSLESKTRALRAHLDGQDADATDPLAAARTAIETRQAEIARLEPLLQSRDQRLDQHRQATDRLVAMTRYLDGLERQSTRVDVITLPAWQQYQDGLDDLVSLIVDCDALASLTNDLLGRRSEERLSVVNRNLGEYFSLITGEERAAARGLTVETRATATRLGYRIVDAGGDLLLPILNQASLNAIALAILFAQARDRAERGGPALLVLDDPEQSLDADHVAGLAKVLEQMTASMPVIVALPPGGLEERIRDYASCPKHFIRLNPWNPDTGATIRPPSIGDAAS